MSVLADAGNLHIPVADAELAAGTLGVQKVMARHDSQAAVKGLDADDQVRHEQNLFASSGCVQRSSQEAFRPPFSSPSFPNSGLRATVAEKRVAAVLYREPRGFHVISPSECSSSSFCPQILGGAGAHAVAGFNAVSAHPGSYAAP
jgi:hypothetical protein